MADNNEVTCWFTLFEHNECNVINISLVESYKYFGKYLNQSIKIDTHQSYIKQKLQY